MGTLPRPARLVTNVCPAAGCATAVCALSASAASASASGAAAAAACDDIASGAARRGVRRAAAQTRGVATRRRGGAGGAGALDARRAILRRQGARSGAPRVRHARSRKRHVPHYNGWGPASFRPKAAACSAPPRAAQPHSNPRSDGAAHHACRPRRRRSRRFARRLRCTPLRPRDQQLLSRPPCCGSALPRGCSARVRSTARGTLRRPRGGVRSATQAAARWCRPFVLRSGSTRGPTGRDSPALG
jgi:hypothetical protein